MSVPPPPPPRDGGNKKTGRGPSGGPSRGPARGPARDARPPRSFEGRPAYGESRGPREGRNDRDSYGDRSSSGERDGRDGRGEREQWLPHDIRIVFEDADLIVVDKPHGLLSATMEGQGMAPSVFSEVKRHVRDSGFKPGRARASKREGETQRSGTRVWVIHRLDREASGLMVFAKSLRAFDVIKEELRVRRVQRSYVAVVEGIVGSRVGEVGSVQSYLWEDERGAVHSGSTPLGGGPLGRSPKKKAVGRGPLGPIGKARAQRDANKPGGDRDGDQLARMAVTHYRVAAHSHGRSMLELKLDTGRKHQIRVHMRELGHVIVGDRRYQAQSDPIGRVCLHARTLAFAHPVTGEPLKFESPTPGAFIGLIGKDAVADGSGDVLQSISAAPMHASSVPAREARPVAKSGADNASAEGDDAGWDHVAEWYEGFVGGRKSDHHERVIFPGVLRLLEPRAGMRVLDVACGEGELCRRLTQAGLDAVGVDAAPKLVGFATAAQSRLETPRGKGPRGSARYLVADATRLHEVDLREDEKASRGEPRADFDAATCVMALMNMAPIEPVMAGVARWLRPGGHLVAVVLHPAFRAPGQTSWQWDGEGDNDEAAGERTPGGRSSRDWRDSRQYRRVDAYLSPSQRSIVMNPGAEARGGAAITTITHHRPIQVYVRAMAQAGLLVDAMEEWASTRRSEPGPRAAEEDRARREIPMFLAIRAVRVGGSA